MRVVFTAAGRSVRSPPFSSRINLLPVMRARWPGAAASAASVTSRFHLLPATIQCVQPRWFQTSSPASSDSPSAPSGDRDNNAAVPDRYLTVPNALTVIRMGLAPYVSYALVVGQPVGALAAFAVAGALDGIDGWIARRFNQSSVIGSYLDPLADKILVGCTSLTLAWTGALPWWVVTVMVGRDAGLLLGGLWFRAKTKPAGVGFFDTSHSSTLKVEPSALSKANTGLQLLLIMAGLTGAAWGVPGPQAITGLSALVTATTIGSGYGYWVKKPYAAVTNEGRKLH